jgi:hypothetical protein
MAVIKKISELTAKGSNIGANDLVVVGVSNGTDYDLKSVTGNQLVSAAVAQTITSGITTTAPSQDAVKTALDLKVDKVTGSRLITSAESTLIGNTSGVNSGDETVTTIKTKLGITTLSGSNTGDQDLSGYQPLLSGGTTNRLTKWSSSSAIGVSLIQDNGTTLSIGTTPVANNLFKVSSNSTDTTLVSENSQATGVGISGTSSGANGVGGSFTSTSVTGVKIGVNASATGAGGTNKGAVFGATGGATNYSIQLTDGTEGSGKFLKSVTANGEANWASIANTDVSGLGSLATQSGTFSGTSSGTNTGDQIISDATITTTDITTNNFTTAKHGFVPKGTNVGNFLKDDGTWGTPASGSSGGIVGIANSSGVYTYYATLTLAMAAAVSGNTIELFADITETGSVAITLKSGVKINGNGHTYTLSVNDNTHALICSSTVEVFNWKVVRTGRANGSGGYVLNCSGGTLRANAVIMQNTYGTAVIDGVAIYGLNAIGYYNGFAVLYENPKLYDCIGESTGLGSGIESPYTVNCIGIAVSGNGITGNGTHLNSTGISTSGSGISGQTFTGCIGISTSGTGASCTSQGRNCIGISTSGIGGTGIFYESTLISSSNYGCQATIYSSYTHSVSSVATNSSNIYNSTVRCLWDNAAGHCTSTNGLSSIQILNSFLEVTNASAYCITGYIGSTWKYSNNSFKGSTVAVNATNITQGITNLSDTKGNILI